MFPVSSGWNLPPGLPSVSSQLHVQPHQNNQDQHVGYHQHVRSVFVGVRVCVCVWERERECVCVCVWMHVYLCVWEFVCHWFYLTASVFIQNPPVILTDTHTYIHHTYGDGKGVKIHFSFMACHDDRSVWDIFIKCVWTFNMDRTNTLVRELISAQKDRTSTTKTGVTYGNSHLACVWVQGTWTPPEVKGI